MTKKVVFMTGTRADYGKLKSLMRIVEADPEFEMHIFVTGMHLLSKYGATYREIEKDNYKNIYKFVNQKEHQTMDITLSNTIIGFSNYVSELKPDLIIVHGDRVEALAGAIVGAFNNIRVAHIEGGEISGTIDESIRHAITKFAHIHLVANEDAKKRVLQLGEKENMVFVIGSPDIDVMFSRNLPTLEDVRRRYNIYFDNYGIVMYHPVTTESAENLRYKAKCLVDALVLSGQNFVVIYPNNDEGTNIILNEYERLRGNEKFKIFPSIRFEYFLTLMKHCDFMIGNSSAGVRESSVYGIPSIDLGNRQMNRYDADKSKNIVNIPEDTDLILDAIANISQYRTAPYSYFGNGDSDKLFISILKNEHIWTEHVQKCFVTSGD
jgi:UDP-N-acetylglucosamine 2-epimerase (hydrolysing)